MSRAASQSLRRGHKDLPLEDRHKILTLSRRSTRQQLSEREIQNETNIPRSTVGDILRHAEQQAKSSTDEKNPLAPVNLLPKVRKGRPRKFDDNQRRQIVECATVNASQRCKPWSQIARELKDETYNMDIHRTHVGNILREAGYSRCIAESKPRLSDKNKKKRESFARTWKDCPIRFTPGAGLVNSFDGWIFTDEMQLIAGKSST
jgi:transposase